jgi:hypothetical protein
MKYLFFLCFGLFFASAGCDLLTNSKEDTSTTIRKIIEGEIEYSVSVPTNNFTLRDTLTVTFNVKNNSTSPKSYHFANVQQLGLNITDKSNRSVISYPLIVSPALSSFIVNPGESKTLTAKSLFKNSGGNYIPTGDYNLNAYLLDRNSPQLSLRISMQ